MYSRRSVFANFEKFVHISDTLCSKIHGAELSYIPAFYPERKIDTAIISGTIPASAAPVRESQKTCKMGEMLASASR